MVYIYIYGAFMGSICSILYCALVKFLVKGKMYEHNACCMFTQVAFDVVESENQHFLLDVTKELFKRPTVTEPAAETKGVSKIS